MSQPHQSEHRHHGGGMDVEDVDIAWAERDASPDRYRSYDPNDELTQEYTRIHGEQTEDCREVVEEVEEQEAEAEAEDEPRGAAHGEGPHGTPNETGSIASDGSSVRREALHTQGSSRQRQQLRQRQTSNTLALSTTSTKMERILMEYIDRHPTAIMRIENHRLQHMRTVGSRKELDENVDLPEFGAGKPYPPPLPEREEYVVEFTGHDDPRHPQNFPLKKKLIISTVLVFDSLAATFASSIFSAAEEAVEKHFHEAMELVTLGTSFFVLGYALGPIIFAPMSELYGRRVPVIIGAFGFAIFNTAVAVSKDFQTLLICRFFSGLFGSSPITLCGAVFADMYNNETRGIAISLFAATLMNGPFCGPFVGGFVTKTIGWRWVAYLPAFMGYLSLVLVVFLQDETYGPVILVSKAAELRRLTRNWGIHAKQEEVEVDLKDLLINNVTRPLRILFTEPIVLVVTIYMSFIYGLLYLNLTAYALVFQKTYGWSLGVSGLPFIALIVGVSIGTIAVVIMNKSYVRKLKANNNIPVPEWRLPLPMVGGIVFSGGLFWFGWGGYMKSTPWIVPTLAGIFIGFGIFSVFLSSLNYLIDAYLAFSASAIAANTFMRSLFGAIFPLFAYYMFEGIGINWGMSLLGFVAALFIPMPFYLYRYGKGLRAKSKFAPALDIQQDKRRDEESRAQAENEKNENEREETNSSEDEKLRTTGTNGKAETDKKEA